MEQESCFCFKKKECRTRFFLKLNTVFLYYKVQTAVRLGLSQRTTPSQF